MENNQEKETFTFSYSAKEQEEIRQIREKYQPKEEDRMEQLRRLDADATKKGTLASLSVGIISCLVLGTGMSMAMVFDAKWFVPGIVVGCIGLIGVAAAYPLYLYVTKKERERIAPEILKLTDELLGNGN